MTDQRRLMALSTALVFSLAVASPAAAANTAPHCTDSDRVSNGEQVGVGAACSDADANAPFTYRVVSQPAHGTAMAYNAPVPSGVGYKPEPGYTGTDSFTYVANDGQADSNVATVRITVGPPPPPSCRHLMGDGETVASPNADYVVHLTCAPGGDGLPITFVIDAQPSHGAVELRRLNDFTMDVVYRAAPGYAGPDGLTWHGVGPGGLASSPLTWPFSVGGPALASDVNAPEQPAPAGVPAPAATSTPGAPAATDALASIGAGLDAAPNLNSGAVGLTAGTRSRVLYVLRCATACDARVSASLTSRGRRRGTLALASSSLRLNAGATRGVRVAVPRGARARVGATAMLSLRLTVSNEQGKAVKRITVAARIR
jgi:hypothetical protein